MPYTKTTWENEVPASSPVKYAVTDDTLGVVAASATIAPVTSITPGTAIDATNLNNIEDGLEAITNAVEAAHQSVQATKGAISANLPGDGEKYVRTFSSAPHNPNSLWSAGAATRITVPSAGLYLISFRWMVALGSGESLSVDIRRDGTTNLYSMTVAYADYWSGSSLAPEFTRLHVFTAAGYIELLASKSAGSAAMDSGFVTLIRMG